VATLFLLVGRPGAGKTARAKQLAAEHRALRLSPDAWIFPLLGEPLSRRRTFTAQYKLDVVAEYDAAATGEKGAVLRRGLYSSHVIEWRRARDAGVLAGPARPQGRPAADPRDAQIARLQKEKGRLEKELAKARFVADLQAKPQALLETISEGADTGPGSSA